MSRYVLRRESAMFRLWDALPLEQWVSAQELRRLTATMKDGTRHSALTGLVARNLVERRPSRAHLTAYDYLRLPASEAVEVPDGAWPETVTVEGGHDARVMGGSEPFAPPIGGGAEGRPATVLAVKHGTARCAMAGCTERRCIEAYESAKRALGLT